MMDIRKSGRTVNQIYVDILKSRTVQLENVKSGIYS